MTGHAAQTEPDVDYISGGPQRDESKFYQRMGRQRREVMATFTTRLAWDLQQAARDSARSSGESLVDMTTRALRTVLADDETRGIAVPPGERSVAELHEPVIARKTERVTQFNTRIPYDLYDEARARAELTGETIADLTSRGFELILFGQRRSVRRRITEPKVPLVVTLPASLVREVRARCRASGESLSSYVDRALTYMIDHSEEAR